MVQLRQDNALGTLYNIVGFQTKLKYGEQTRVFRMIPGLEKAEFARLGGLHRNTFINSPKLLDGSCRLEAQPRLRFAGQITGVEGYVGVAAIGLLAGRFAAAERLGLAIDRTAADHGARRAAGPHHRRRGGRHLPTDERQLRAFPSPAERSGPPTEGPRAQAGHEPARPRRPAGLAGRPGPGGRIRNRLPWCSNCSA